MTVSRLKQALSTYPDDMEIKVNIDRTLRKLDDVSWGVDMDTNITYVWLVGKEKGK